MSNIIQLPKTYLLETDFMKGAAMSNEIIYDLDYLKWAFEQGQDVQEKITLVFIATNSVFVDGNLVVEADFEKIIKFTQIPRDCPAYNQEIVLDNLENSKVIEIERRKDGVHLGIYKINYDATQIAI